MTLSGENNTFASLTQGKSPRSCLLLTEATRHRSFKDWISFIMESLRSVRRVELSHVASYISI